MNQHNGFGSLRGILFGITLAILASAPVARGQCHDWAWGFGVPGNGMDGDVRALTIYDDGIGAALYAAGGFTHAGGVPAHCVAKWDGTTWSPLGAGVESLALASCSFNDGSGPALYVGGYFMTAGGVSASHIAKWDGATWTPLGSGLDGAVSAIAVHDDGGGPALFVGGTFSMAGGNPANRVAKWDGTSWTALGSGLSSQVNALLSFDDGSGPALYAGCTTPMQVRRWDGSNWSLPGSGVAGDGVLALASFGGSLYAAGGIQYGNGGATVINHIARWDGSLWYAVGNNTNGGGTNSSIESLGVFNDGSGSALYVGGVFDRADSIPAREMAKWDGAAWSALGTGMSGVSSNSPTAIAGLTTFGGARLYVGGTFDHSGDKPSRYFAEWGVACTAPTFILQPVDTTTVFPQPVVFSIVADGTAPISYQWRKDGVPISNVFEKIEGATTPTMTLYYWSLNDEGSYDCVATNALGATTSNEAVLTVPGGGTTGAEIVLTPVLVPPTPVPGFPGGTYDSFGGSVQSSTNDVAFYGRLGGIPGSSHSLNLWQSGTIQLVAKDGDQAPGTPSGVVFDSLQSFRIGANERLAFSARLRGAGVDSTNNQGVWFRDSTGQDLVARFGDPAGGSAPGATFESYLHLAGVGDTGTVVFDGAVYLGGSYLERGFWGWDRSSGQVRIAVSGDPAPGTSDTFANLQSSQIVENRSGSVVVMAGLSGAATWGVWTGLPGSLQLVALGGDQVPGYPTGTVFQSFLYPALNEVGDVAFQATIQDPGGATHRILFRWTAGNLVTVVAQDDPAPGTQGSVFFYPYPLVMNDSGAIVFYSQLAQGNCQGECPQYGAWFADGNGILPIVMNRSDPLPGEPTGFVMQNLNAVALNNSEQVVLSVRVAYGTSYGATYGWTSGHGLFPVAVPGTQTEVSTGDYRTVAGSGISYLDGGSGGGGIQGEGASGNLNDAGQVLVGFGFTDNTNAILVGQFATYQSAFYAPGTPFCAGDGSLPIPCPCGNSGQAGHGCNNSIGSGGAVLTSLGGASLAVDTASLTSTGEPRTALSVFIQGSTRLGAGVPFGDGVRCIGGILKRIAVKAAVRGVVTYPKLGELSISEKSSHLGDVIHAGETRYYQVYYRDPAPSFCPPPGGSPFNTSSGQSILWFP